MADESSTSWTIPVSRKVDAALRIHLAQRGLDDADLSRFVEDAVRWRVLDQTIAEARAQLADVPAEELQAIVDEALAWARAEPSAAGD